MVWAHAEGPLSSYIYQFHMPFFFFVSGLLYYNKKASLFDYAKRKCKSLLVPFWKWNFICFPIYFVLYYWKSWSISRCLKEIAEIAVTLNKVPFLGATWFLAALFWVSVIVHACVLRLAKFKYGDIILLLGAVLVCVFAFYVTLPYRISRTLICALFYVGGYLYQKYLRKYINSAARNIGGILCGGAYIVIASNNTVAMGSNEYQYKLAFVVGAFMATAFTLWLSKQILKVPVLSTHLSYLGRNSIDIVIWQFLAFRITIIVQIIVMGAGINAIVAFPVYDASGVWWIAYLAAGIYGSLLWKYILKNNPISKRRLKEA